MTTFHIYVTVFIADVLYTVLLVFWRHLLEPDLTILEVIFGTVLCLAPAALDQRINGPLTSEVYEWRVWLGFLIGVIPIGIWQITQSIQARLDIERGIRGLRDDTTRHSSDEATGVATKRGRHSETRD